MVSKQTQRSGEYKSDGGWVPKLVSFGILTPHNHTGSPKDDLIRKAKNLSNKLTR